MLAANRLGESGAATPRRRRAEIHLWEADVGAFLGCETKGAPEREFDAAAETVPEEGGDRWFAHRLDAADQRQSLIEEGVDAARLLQALGQLLEIHANGEVRSALGGDDERTDRVVGGDFLGRFAEHVDVLERHAVERIVVGGDDRDAVVALGQDQCIGHGGERRWRPRFASRRRLSRRSRTTR